MIHRHFRALCSFCLLAGAFATLAHAEDLSGGPYYVRDVYQVDSPFVDCKPMPEASLAKTMWSGPYGTVRLIGDSGTVTLRENAFMIEDEAGIVAADGFDGVLAVKHDGSLATALRAGNVIAGSFGIREIVDVRPHAEAMADFAPLDTKTLSKLPRESSYRMTPGGLTDGFVEIETVPVGFGHLFCDAELVVHWDPIPGPFETTPLGGDCQGHSPCEVVLPVAQENSYEAPTFDPYASESGVESRSGGVFNCPKVKLGKFQIRPNLTIGAPELTLTIRVFQGVARLDGSAELAAGLLISVQEEVLAKLRCEADFLRMVTGKEIEITLATFPVFGIPVQIYLKPFVTGFVELTSDVPRIEVDLEGRVEPTLTLGWDGGPLADFALNPGFDAAVRMEPASSTNPWGVDIEAGIDVGAELGAKAGGTILGVGATVKLYVKPFERLSTELSIQSHQPCVFNLTAELATKLKFGVKFVLKVIFNILFVELESLPISIGPTINLLEEEWDLAAFGCADEPDWEVPMGGVDQWLCSVETGIFSGPGAQQACSDARNADPACGMTGSNPHGATCDPVGAEQTLCGPCEELGFAGIWVYEAYDCICGEPQSCEYPCCTANSDCNAGEHCNQAGVCVESCGGSGDLCDDGSDCCSGDCQCVFGCGIPAAEVKLCS